MFKPNLATEPEGPVSFPKLASVKLDGIRVVTKFGGALTRSLKPVPNLYLREKLAPYQNLDGEVIVGPENAPDVYRRTNSAVMSIEGTFDFKFYVFDDLHNPVAPLSRRLDDLRNRPLPPFIRVLEQTTVNDQAHLDNLYAHFLDRGYEGAILRNPQSIYKYGRSTAKSQDMLKLKPFTDSEAIVLSTYEAMENQNEAFTNELGQTERSTHQENLVGKGMVGGFIVKDLKSGVEFNCSPGALTHDERRELFLSKNEGKILKYRSMAYGVKEKPRFPRFIGWRSTLDM